MHCLKISLLLNEVLIIYVMNGVTHGSKLMGNARARQSIKW